MKRWILFVSLLLFESGKAQVETDPARMMELESRTEKNNAEPEDDSYETELDLARKHPLNLNMADGTSLTALHMLTAIQVRNFLSYRALLGPLLTIHELQAVPGWDIQTIHKILFYVTIQRDESVYTALRERWKGGDASFLLRAGQVLEPSVGFIRSAASASYYEGSPLKLFMRYMYNYKQLLSYGFTGDKDAGEPFFRRPQQAGFDFYSFHFFLRQSGILKALALGDFTVNLGQGLIQWQTISFTKTSQPLAIKREAENLRPYHSAGEYNFHRGVGLDLQKGKWDLMTFISYRKISTNVSTDTAGREDLFSSFQNSGYHRTPAEIADRNNSAEFSTGGSVHYRSTDFAVGINAVYFSFSRTFAKRDEPYNVYALKGKRLTDFSLDYSYTRGNMHVFGEVATDQWFNRALVTGALISLSEQLDLSLLYRNISPAFKSLYSDAFTENSVPNNEEGMYAGLAFRPRPGVQLNIYYDVFVFPWLKYRVDAPSAGRDLLVACSYQPVKSWALSAVYKNESKAGNGLVQPGGSYGLSSPVKQKCRIELDLTVSRSWGLASRLELLWLKTPGLPVEKGFLGTSGVSFHGRGFSASAALTLFETDGYESRIYSYESDLLYNFSLPAYYGKGVHCYINLHRDLSEWLSRSGNKMKMTVWLNWGQTFYPGYASIGSGLDEIPGSRKSVLKAQLIVEWN